MTPEEYKSQLNELKKEANQKELELAKTYAFKNNTYEKGDIVTDHIGSVLIVDMKLFIGNRYIDMPSLIYKGIELKKDGKPKKGNPMRDLYQINIIN